MIESSIIIDGRLVYYPEFEVDTWDMYPHVYL